MKKVTALLLTTLLAITSVCGCNGTNGGTEDVTAEPDFSSEKVFSTASTSGTFYYPDKDFNNFDTKVMDFDGTVQDVVDKLYELGNYGTNKVKVNSWYIRGNTLFADFDKGLKAATGSSAQEYFSVNGTVKTLLSCYGVDYVYITINGGDFKTPHGEYDRPLF